MHASQAFEWLNRAYERSVHLLNLIVKECSARFGFLIKTVYHMRAIAAPNLPNPTLQRLTDLLLAHRADRAVAA